MSVGFAQSLLTHQYYFRLRLALLSMFVTQRRLASKDELVRCDTWNVNCERPDVEIAIERSSGLPNSTLAGLACICHIASRTSIDSDQRFDCNLQVYEPFDFTISSDTKRASTTTILSNGMTLTSTYRQSRWHPRKPHALMEVLETCDADFIEHWAVPLWYVSQL